MAPVTTTSSNLVNPSSSTVSLLGLSSQSVNPSVASTAPLTITAVVGVIVIVCCGAVILSVLLAYVLYRGLAKKKTKASLECVRFSVTSGNERILFFTTIFPFQDLRDVRDPVQEDVILERFRPRESATGATLGVDHLG